MNLDQQINAICDVLARDSGFVATQDAMHQSKRAGEAARGQEPPKKTALQECAEYHEQHAELFRSWLQNAAGGVENCVWSDGIAMHIRFATACREANEQ